MEILAKIVNYFYRKILIKDVWQGPKHVSVTNTQAIRIIAETKIMVCVTTD